MPEIKPYFWVSQGKKDAERERRRKRNKKRVVGALDFRSVAITLAAVGVVIFLQDAYKNNKRNELSDLTRAWADFKETESQAIDAAVVLRFNIGNIFPMEESDYDSSDMDSLFIDNFSMALDTRDPKTAQRGLDQYNEAIYGIMSSFESTNKRLAEKTRDVVESGTSMDNKNASAVAANAVLIELMFENHHDKLASILDLQLKILKIISGKESGGREGEISTAMDKIQEYYTDLDWQTDKIGEANEEVQKAFINLED